MKTAEQAKENTETGVMDRLIQAVVALWETSGTSGTTLRAITAMADVRGSSLYHHFGNLDQLYLSAQEYALARASEWCEAQLASLPPNGALPLAALPQVMASLIDEWCEARRPLAFAWRECQILSRLTPAFIPITARWSTLWLRFWQEICDRAGIPQHAQLTAHFFDGESVLHLMRWRRTLDRACLEEICQGWSDWLQGNMTLDRPCRDFARGEAGKEMPDLIIHNDTMQRIADAAADVMASETISGLTHRAVAKAAGLTLGVVSHNFRSSADLLRAAFETTYQRMVHLTRDDGPIRQMPMRKWENSIRHSFSLIPSRAAIDQLYLAVARSADLKPFAPQLRYWRGRGSGPFLQELAGADRKVSQLDAAVLSSLLSGSIRGLQDDDVEGTVSAGRETITAISALLQFPATDQS